MEAVGLEEEPQRLLKVKEKNSTGKQRKCRRSKDWILETREAHGP